MIGLQLLSKLPFQKTQLSIKTLAQDSYTTVYMHPMYGLQKMADDHLLNLLHLLYIILYPMSTLLTH